MTTEAEPRLDDAAKSPILDSLLGTLADRVLSDASGANIPAGARLGAQPQRNLWLGMLASEHEIADLPAFIGERRVPAAHGFTFRVAALPVRLDVTVTAALYLPILPTAAEQEQASSDPLDRSGADGDGSPAAGPGPAATAANIPLTERTTKVTALPVTVGITVEEGLCRHGQHELAGAFQHAVRHAHRTAALGLFRPPGGATRRARTPATPPATPPGSATWAPA